MYATRAKELSKAEPKRDGDAATGPGPSKLAS